VRQSRIAGFGLFAVERIDVGEVCCRLSGTPMSDAEFTRHVERNPRYSALAIDEDLHLVQTDDDPTTKGNHSCDPNMWLLDAVTVVARRSINVDDEATIDYALCAADDRWSMKCNCGSALCRGVVRGSDWRLRDLQRRYRGHWTPFLERRIDRTRSG
jgi:hypothetical protein